MLPLSLLSHDLHLLVERIVLSTTTRGQIGESAVLFIPVCNTLCYFVVTYFVSYIHRNRHQHTDTPQLVANYATLKNAFIHQYHDLSFNQENGISKYQYLLSSSRIDVFPYL